MNISFCRKRHWSKQAYHLHNFYQIPNKASLYHCEQSTLLKCRLTIKVRLCTKKCKTCKNSHLSSRLVGWDTSRERNETFPATGGKERQLYSQATKYKVKQLPKGLWTRTSPKTPTHLLHIFPTWCITCDIVLKSIGKIFAEYKKINCRCRCAYILWC